MRGLVLAEFGRMEVRDIAEPHPADDEVLIKVEAVGICGTDVHGYTGANGRRVPGQVMGHEAAGTLLTPTGDLQAGQPVTFTPLVSCGHCEDCRDGEQQHCPNRRVIGVNPEIQAAFAERLAVPARNVVALSPALPTARGALVEPLAVAFHAVRRAGVAEGERVLIVGGGPIGQSMVLAARARSAGQVIVSEPSPVRRELCASLGVDVVDPTAAPLADQVRDRWGRAADRTIDAVGLTRSIGDALTATKTGGVVTLVGMGSPRLELSSFDVSTGERSLVGSFCYADADFRRAAAWAGEHAELLSGLISEQVGMDRAPEAFAGLAGDAPAAGKVLVLPNE